MSHAWKLGVKQTSPLQQENMQLQLKSIGQSREVFSNEDYTLYGPWHNHTGHTKWVIWREGERIEENVPNIRLLGRFLLWEPNRNRELSVFLEKNSWQRVKWWVIKLENMSWHLIAIKHMRCPMFYLVHLPVMLSPQTAVLCSSWSTETEFTHCRQLTFSNTHR